jgi:Uri superfamily endonuclease
MKGVYILILKLDLDSDIQIGKLGKLHFRKGFYAYTGSALGTGGFKRVERHFNIATGKNPTRKWHIDYLLPKSKIVHAILLPTEDAIECKLARSLKKISGISIISGFGCTDCICETHLIYAENDPREMIIDICNNIGIKAIIMIPQTIKNKLQ